MKSLINMALLKHQMRKHWVLMICQAMPYVLVIIALYGSNDSIARTEAMISILSMHPMIFIGVIPFQMITVLVLFSYLFQSNTATTMHSYPVSRKQLWFTNAICGFIFSLIPLLAMFIIMLAPVEFITSSVTDSHMIHSNVRLPLELFPDGLERGQVINTFPIMLGFLFRAILILAFYYAVFIFAISVAGNATGYILVGITIPFVAVSFVTAYNFIAWYYVLGYVLNNSMIFTVFSLTNALAMSSTFTYADPINVVWTGWSEMSPGQDSVGLTHHILSYTIITLALLVASFKLYMIRKQERSSYTIVFTHAKNILVFLGCLAGSLLTGLFALMALGTIVSMYIGLVVGFVVLYFVANMIVDQTFKPENKLKGLVMFGAIAVISVFGTATITRIFQESSIPDANDVVGINLSGTQFSLSGFTWNHPSDLITDPNIIEEVLRVHGEIVDNSRALRQTFLRNVERNHNNDIIMIQNINYILVDGTVLHRTYFLPLSFYVDSGLARLLLEEPVILSRGMINILDEPDKIDWLNIRIWETDPENMRMWEMDPDHNVINIMNSEHILDIVPHIRRDFVANSRNERNRWLQLWGVAEEDHIAESHSASMRISVFSDWIGHQELVLGYTQNMFRWLQENGYINR